MGNPFFFNKFKAPQKKCYVFILISLCVLGLYGIAQSEWEDVSNNAAIIQSRPFYNFVDQTTYFDVSIQNLSENDLLPPLMLVIDSITASGVTAYNADGLNFEGKPYYSFDAYLDGDSIASGGTSLKRRLEFYNPQRMRFLVEYKLLTDRTTLNSPPQADAGFDQTVIVGERVYLDGSGSTDADGDLLNFRWQFFSTPEGSTAALSDSNSLMPFFDVDLSGIYEIELIVNDDQVDSLPDIVQITTRNSPPVADAGPDQSIYTGETVYLDGSGSTDVDSDPLIYSWSFVSTPPDSNTFLMDAMTVNPYFEADVFGSYVVQLIVNDGQEDSAEDTVTFNTANSRPVAYAGPDEELVLLSEVLLDGSGSHDVDLDPLTYKWALVSIPSGSTAVLSNPTTARPFFTVDRKGSYVVQLIVNDGTEDSLPDTLRIDVPNSPPQIVSTPVLSASVDQAYLYQVNAVDPDIGDTLTFSLAKGPAGMSLEPGSGLLQWLPASDQQGEHEVIVRVNDSESLQASQIFTIFVSIPNAPPQITSLPLTAARTGTPYNYNVSASDPNKGDTLTFSLEDAPADMDIHSESGMISWIPALNHPKTPEIKVVVKDQAGLFDSQSFVIKVQDSVLANGNPVITSQPALIHALGPEYVYPVTAVDAEDHPLSYSLSSAPEGMAIDGNTGRINWTPLVSGDYPVALVVRDTQGGQANQSYILSVEEPNVPPQIISVPELSSLAGMIYTYPVEANDPNGDTLAFSLTQAPLGMQIDPLTGEITWTPDSAQIGEHPVTVRVTDPEGPATTQTYTLVVTADTNNVPIAVAGADQMRPPGVTITLDGSGSYDPDGDQLTYQWAFQEKPEGSNAELLDTTSVTPAFMSDVIGVYVLTLIVNDGLADSEPDSVKITITSQVVTGIHHTCVLTDGGGVECWGDNYIGQLGIGVLGPPMLTTDDEPFGIPFPVTVVSFEDGQPLKGIVELSSKGDHTCALTENGAVKCWGYAIHGELGDGIHISARPAAVNVLTEPEGVPLSGITTIAASNGASCGVVSDGTMKCWGWGNLGQLANDDLTYGVSGYESNVPIYALETLDGDPLSGVVDVSTSTSLTCAVMADTTVKCWGENTYGGVGNGALPLEPSGGNRIFEPQDVLVEPGGAKLTGVVEVSAGGGFACALMENTGVKCWGWDTDGKLGDGSAQSGETALNGLPIRTTPTDVLNEDGGEPLTGVVAISTGQNFSCAVMEDNGIKCWGTGSSGFGNGTTLLTSFTTPVDVLAGPGQGPLKGAVSVSVGYNSIGREHVCAAMENGDIKCWGYSWSGQLGNGEVGERLEGQGVYPEYQHYPAGTLLGQDAVLIAAKLSPEDQTLAPGESLQYKAIGIMSDAGTQDLSQNVTWSLDHPDVAQIDASGNVTALKSGVTTVRFSYEGISQSATLIVASSELTGIEVSPESAFVLSAQNRDSSGCLINDPDPCRPLDFSLTEQQFTATGGFADGTRLDLTSVTTWESSSSAAAIAPGGLAAGIGLGQSVIKAEFNGLTGSGILNVVEVVDSDTTPPVVSLSPEDNTLLLGLSDISGTVQDDNLLEYELAVSPPGETQFQVIASGTMPLDGVVASLDTATMENGLYNVKLTAKDQGGNTASVTRVYRVQDQAKIGLFSLSFVDLSIPVSGIPIEVIRTYDSRVKSTRDFGVGWNLEIRRGSFKHNRQPGEGWQILEGGGLFGLPCQFVSETASHITEVRLSDTEYYRFKLVLSGPAALSGGCTAEAGFEFIDGTVPGATLDILDGTGVFYENATNQVLKIGTTDTVFNPNRVRLTTPDGRIIEFDNQSGGVVRVEDINGNALDITDTGIIHSSGKSINFTRDSAGRITEIIDPMGNILGYDYDGAGDLVAFTDQEDHQTTFTYDRLHNLIDIYDPLGNRAIRNEYDASGRLVASVDHDGNRREMTHDIENRREAITDSLGRVTVHEYDEQGNVLVTIDALGNQTTYTYDTNGNELTVTDPLGNVTTNTYDASNNLLTVTDPLGNITINTYTTRNQLKSIIDPLGNTTTYIYPVTSGNLEGITDPLGNTTGMGYDRAGNLSSMTDPLGNNTSFTYDGSGNRITETDPLGNATTYTFDDNGNALTKSAQWTNADGTPVSLVTTRVYDALNRVTQITDPLGNVSRTEYNAIGKVGAEVDKLGRRTEYEYDSRGNKVRTSYPDGTEESVSFDSEGNQIATTDRQGRTTSYVYDALNRLVETQYPDGSRTKTVFDAAGREIASIDANGNETTSEYDDAGNRTKVIDALGFVTSFEYDAADKQTTITDAAGNITSFEYDAAGRLIGNALPDGTDSRNSFDAGGRLVEKTDAAGNNTAYEYDAYGRLKAVIDALGNRTKYGYNEQGNLVSQTDANGNTTRYEYNGIGQRVATILPLGQRSSSSYDAQGNIISNIDFNGDTIIYAYNANNQLVSKRLPDDTVVSFTYTATGQRATVTDSRGVTLYEYDEKDRLLSRTDPGGESISYTYDTAGNRTSVKTPSGTTSYTFDQLNRIETVTAPEGGVTTYQYDVRGNLERTFFANDTLERRFYDSVSRLVSIESSHLISGEQITLFDYTLDSLGNRVAVYEHDGRRVEYQYDTLSRLIRETIYDAGAATASRVVNYTYDNVGNRLLRDDSSEGSSVYSYDANDRLLEENKDGVVSLYSYDNNGNTLSKTTDGLTIGYNWNGENRLVAVDIDGDGNNELNYSYDVDGIRVGKVLNGDETKYLIDANMPYAQVLEELNVTGLTLVSYVHGNDLISQQRSGATSYYHVDGLGSTRALSDDSGVRTDLYVFDAYGQIIEQVGVTDNLYLYGGEQRDYNIGLDYLRARYLNVDSGKFVSRDIFQGYLITPISRQPYIYANSNPANANDPSGKVTLLSITGAGSIRNNLRAIQAGFLGGRVKDIVSDTSTVLSMTGFALDVVMLFNTFAIDYKFPHTKTSLTILDRNWNFNKFSNIKSAAFKITATPDPNIEYSVGFTGRNDLFSKGLSKGTGKGTNLSFGFTWVQPDYKKSSIALGGVREWELAENVFKLSLELKTSVSASGALKATLEAIADMGNGRFQIGLLWNDEGVWVTK